MNTSSITSPRRIITDPGTQKDKIITVFETYAPIKITRILVEDLSYSFNMTIPHVETVVNFPQQETISEHRSYIFGDYIHGRSLIQIDGYFAMALSSLFHDIDISSISRDISLMFIWNLYQTVCHEYYHYLNEPYTVSYKQVSQERLEIQESSAEHFARVVVSRDYHLGSFEERDDTILFMQYFYSEFWKRRNQRENGVDPTKVAREAISLVFNI